MLRSIAFFLAGLLVAIPATSASHQARNAPRRVTVPWQGFYDLPAGRVVEIGAHLEKPSALPPNGRVEAIWSLEPGSGGTGSPAATGAGWRKLLHALDGDVSLVYRAPVAGRYSLRLRPFLDGEPVSAGPRWRENGTAPELVPIPTHTPWPKGTLAPAQVSVRPLPLGDAAEEARLRTVVECEPNDTPEQAQPIVLTGGEGVLTWEVTGGADDIEFFDNGRVGRSGEDWFRIEYRGASPRLLTAQLGIPGQSVAARIRAYRWATNDERRTTNDQRRTTNDQRPTTNDRKTARAPQSRADEPAATVATAPGTSATLVVGRWSLVEYRDGRDANERVHQQEEQHRANICRMLRPGGSYLLRVEANAPGYQLQLRVLRPAPYADPRMAVRQGMYTQIGQVDAWLTNRPRGASVDRRIRDSGNLLGTGCMSCHTQSGVWGPAVPLAKGYRLENVQNYWHLVNVMYECLRPTNALKDAANNTSLAPLDTGDGPAGTRAAGFNIVQLERFRKPRVLHSAQQIRTANYVLQTRDPGGINAAGAGSNVGQVVVYLFASEILKAAWEKSRDPKYLRALEEKARRILDVSPRYTDDVALRLHCFGRLVPLSWLTTRLPQPEVAALAERARAQMVQDEARLRALQNPDGSWGFDPGSTPDGGKTWKRGKEGSDPAPTALAILGLNSAGRGAGDPAIARGVKALLAMQEPTGRWNRSAETGFVTSAYALHALAHLYPERPVVRGRAEFEPRPGESLRATLRRVQALAVTGDPKLVELMLVATRHESALVRYWAIIGLGGTHTDRGVPALIGALSDPSKSVREAAVWALRQTLLDNRGWDAVVAAYERGDDFTREGVVQALGMRADAVLPLAGKPSPLPRVAALLSRAMNVDPHPAVRAWAAKAAWQWWVWNPPVRASLNNAWVRMLERPENNALAENSLRYSSHALFIANGHRANSSRDHQYKELASLFEALTRRLDAPASAQTKARLANRLVGIGATFYNQNGGDGGPGQMGYVTAGAADLFGKAATSYFERIARPGANLQSVRIGLEGASGVPYPPLTDFLMQYALKGPEELRGLAASAVSDPRSVSLPAVPELVEPQLRQVQRGAREPSRRAQLSDPILTLWRRVNWVVPKTEEQQRVFFDLILPRFDRYASAEEIAAIADPARRSALEREMDAAWYLADRLGQVLQENPDLHQAIVLQRYFPIAAPNALEAHFWVRSVEWILKSESREGGAESVAKDRALQLYLDQLGPKALPRTRSVALRLANRTALRRNPEVLLALGRYVAFEKDAEARQIAERVLRQGKNRFLPDLMASLKQERHPSIPFTAGGEPAPTQAQVDDILYFRDYVMPELNRQKRSDQMACMGCHGVRGRVPSLELRAPDEVGYSSVADLLFNYRALQQRVSLADLPASKLLRKPLNVQDGQEDGHQGGRRYAPTDEGYLILKRWAENQPVVQRPAMAAAEPREERS
jgi:hypothetical protein